MKPQTPDALVEALLNESGSHPVGGNMLPAWIESGAAGPFTAEELAAETGCKVVSPTALTNGEDIIRLLNDHGTPTWYAVQGEWLEQGGLDATVSDDELIDLLSESGEM